MVLRKSDTIESPRIRRLFDVWLMDAWVSPSVDILWDLGQYFLYFFVKNILVLMNLY